MNNFSVKNSIFLLLRIALTQTVHAHEKQVHEAFFPIQSYFYQDTSLNRFINPFRMPTLEIGIPIQQVHCTNITSIFSKEKRQFIQLTEMDTKTSYEPFIQLFDFFYNFHCKLHIPLYDTLQSIGIQYEHTAHNIIIKSYPMNSDAFNSMLSHSVVGVYTWRKLLPSNLPCALAITPKFGPTVFYGETKTIDFINFTGCIGITFGIDTALEFYFSQWLGSYIVYSLNGHIIPPSVTTEDARDTYCYCTSAFRIGIKSTYLPSFLGG